MQSKDFTVSSMHGDLDQKERDTIVSLPPLHSLL
jgi:superfamily II DNA/RNA helicase